MSGSDNLGSVKKALVIRYGAYGDAVVVTPVLRLLKEEGYHVTLNCSDYSMDVYRRNPNIDDFMIHKTNSVPNTRLGEYWEELSKGFDRVVNLSESVERTLLKLEGTEEFNWPKERRHAECNVNYYDRTLDLAGFPEHHGTLPELFFSQEEEGWAQSLRKQFKNRFVVLWSLSGSSLHKVYHGTDEVARAFLDKHPDAVTFSVGGELEALLEWDHPSARKKCGQWSIRKSMIMTKYADLVVGSETGVLNASACYETPKIVLLSHSSNENLSKYWKNCTPLHSNAECYPCHQLHYTLRSCPLEPISTEPSVHYKVNHEAIKGFKTEESYPACMAKLKPDQLYEAIERVYNAWKKGVKTWPHLQPQLQLQ